MSPLVQIPPLPRLPSGQSGDVAPVFALPLLDYDGMRRCSFACMALLTGGTLLNRQWFLVASWPVERKQWVHGGGRVKFRVTEAVEDCDDRVNCEDTEFARCAA